MYVPNPRIALAWVTFRELLIRSRSLSWKFSVALVLSMKLEIYSSSAGSHWEMLRIVTWAIHPAVSTQACDPINQAGYGTLCKIWPLETLANLKNSIKTFHDSCSGRSHCFSFRTQHTCYLLLSMAVDRCSHTHLFCQATGASEERDMMYWPLHSPRWLHTDKLRKTFLLYWLIVRISLRRIYKTHLHHVYNHSPKVLKDCLSW